MSLMYQKLRFQTDRLYDLDLKERMVFVTGDSGVGKTYLYNQIAQYKVYSHAVNILCYNVGILTGNLSLEEQLKGVQNKLIILDNADIIVPHALRRKIASDYNNQYLIFCHSTGGYAPANNSIVHLRISRDTCKFEYIYEKLCDRLGCDPNRG